MSYSYSYSTSSSSCSNGFQSSWSSTGGNVNQLQNKFEQLQTAERQSDSESSDTEENFEQEALDIHNKYRALHGVPPLTLDRNLCKYSEEWARNLASRGTMQHRSNSSYGENLYCKYGTGKIDATAKEAVKSWYDEINQYNFNKPGSSGGTGHFTQVVWRGTQRLGMAKAQNSRGQVFIVANYDPPGNVMGQFPSNVPRTGSTSVPAPQEAAAPRVSAPSTPTDSSFSKFEYDCLAAHNDYRAKHSAPPMRLNKHLCQFATEWANRLLAMGTMQHRANNKYGENIYAMFGTGNLTVSGRDPVKSWYDEIKLYNFGRPGFSSGTGHFTQVVWLASTELGVGIAQGNGKVFVVANYNPPGNVQGQFPANVKPMSR